MLLTFLCDCDDVDCSEDIELTLAEYRAVYSGDLRFAVAAGQESTGERVLDDFDRYTVVER